MKVKTLLKTLNGVGYCLQSTTGYTLEEDYISDYDFENKLASSKYGDYKVLKITTVLNCDKLFITIDIIKEKDMPRNFVVIFEVNNQKLFESIFDKDCILGNGLYKMYLGGNCKSTNETIEKRASMVVNRHKGLRISIVDIIEIV